MRKVSGIGGRVMSFQTYVNHLLGEREEVIGGHTLMPDANA